MCFPSMPKVESMAPPPSERDATLDALNRRQASARDEARSGLLSTRKTGAAGVQGSAPVYKQTLGQ
jgi:hypothetical protein